MRTSITAAFCSLMALCAAQPYNITSSKLSNTTTTTSTFCISTADAILIANGFGQILSNFSTSFGDTLIADGYVDQSDSVATLMHSPNLLASDVCLPLFPLPFSSQLSTRKLMQKPHTVRQTNLHLQILLPSRRTSTTRRPLQTPQYLVFLRRSNFPLRAFSSWIGCTGNSCCRSRTSKEEWNWCW